MYCPLKKQSEAGPLVVLSGKAPEMNHMLRFLYKPHSKKQYEADSFSWSDRQAD